MTHREGKKEAKQGDKHRAQPERISYDEMKKHTTKGLIQGTE